MTGEKMRTIRSVAPPADQGTMISISRSGNFPFVCAPAHSETRRKSAAVKSIDFFIFIISDLLLLHSKGETFRPTVP
jgi:hypothetical protein